MAQMYDPATAPDRKSSLAGVGPVSRARSAGKVPAERAGDALARREIVESEWIPVVVHGNERKAPIALVYHGMKDLLFAKS